MKEFTISLSILLFIFGLLNVQSLAQQQLSKERRENLRKFLQESEDKKPKTKLQLLKELADSLETEQRIYKAKAFEK